MSDTEYMGSCTHRTPWEQHCSECWNALVANRDAERARAEGFLKRIKANNETFDSLAAEVKAERDRADKAEQELADLAAEHHCNCNCGDCNDHECLDLPVLANVSPEFNEAMERTLKSAASVAREVQEQLKGTDIIPADVRNLILGSNDDVQRCHHGAPLTDECTFCERGGLVR